MSIRTLVVPALAFLLVTVRVGIGAVPCPGDCNGDGETTIDELLQAVNIALGGAALASCVAADADENGEVTIDDIVVAVTTAADGCPGGSLAVGASKLCFTGLLGTDITAQTVSIQSATGTWRAEPSAAWITVAPSSGQAPAELQVTVRPADLADGAYAGVIRLSDASGASTDIDVGLSLYSPAQKSGWKIQAVEPVTSPGQETEVLGVPTTATSLALDPQGRPGISFYRNDVMIDRQLRFTRWTGCGWQSENVERTGFDSSLAFDSRGQPHISFSQGNGVVLRYAHRGDSGWQVVTVESQQPRGDTGHRTSIAIDAMDRPHISYLLKFLPNNVFAYDLRYAVLDGDQWTIETPDAEGTTGWDTSLVLSPAGEPRISYHTDLPDSLRYAEKSGDSWTLESIAPGGKPSSLRLDSAGRPRIAFNGPPGSSARYAFKDDGRWIVETIDAQGLVRGRRPYVCLALDTAGVPHVAYVAYQNGGLKYATRSNDGSWAIEVIDVGANVGDYCSMQIDRDNVAHISYLDLGRGVLKYAHGPAS
jgi:hypothetical protein